jgi:hypothetical protein
MLDKAEGAYPALEPSERARNGPDIDSLVRRP